MKTCTRCGVCKPLDQFLWKVKADGLRQPHCKPCGNIQAMNWKKNNPEKVKESSKRYAEENREAMKIRRREYYLRKKAENPDILRERTRLWKASPKGRAASKAWLNTPAGREYNRKTAAKHVYPKIVIDWWKSLDYPKCTYCGDPAREIDHIVPVAKGGPAELWNLTPACKPCNLTKRDKDLNVFLEQLTGVAA